MKRKLKSNHVILFRIDAERAKILADYSATQGLNSNLTAKKIVTDFFLDNVNILSIQDDIKELDTKLKVIGLDIAFSVKKLLEIGGVRVGESDNWVSENVRSLIWNTDKEDS